ncbi:SDR family oxidoreductase [Plantactinospora sp. CA-290183]|uniref:SDR family oxidoreductase n=1 Tax=Plantactinospora sp. CA-290183 TaxID=3240006 RepID=UPI003D8E912B
MDGDLVLVTGGSGFVGAHCILRLLQQGYRVRTTVRSLRREPDVRAMIEAGGVAPGKALSFAVADLTRDDGWSDAVADCSYVLHVASPFPANAPRREDEIITPAREGTLRTLRAARDAGVRRTVLTSSFAAVGYGHRDNGRVFTESDWSDPDGAPMTAYAKSKLLAERAAWDFVDREGGGMELAVINPVGIFGPALGPDYSLYIELIEQLMNGAMPALPRLSYGVVDVRDVADLHLRAMADPTAAGERFLASAGLMSLSDIAGLLRARLGTAARRVPTRRLPDWTVRLTATFSPRIAQVIPDLGTVRDASSDKARRTLGWKPRPVEETILDTAHSLAGLGLLRETATAA